MGRRRVALLAAGLAALLVAGCSGSGGAGDGDGGGGALRVVATTTQVADLAANVGGDRVRVTSLLKPGIDAHDHEPSPADIDAIARADLVVQNGVGLEAWLGDTIEKVVTNHDAFGYYLDRYGLELVGSAIPSFDTSAELSGRDIRDLVARIRATGVKAIFSETSLPPRAAETIGREAGVEVVVGADALYGDALGPPGSDGDTYLKMIRHNTATIVGNLSGA
jgi:ABC-type Zn uptake system ZnuABC Zn-binding protein ZnuA